MMIVALEQHAAILLLAPDAWKLKEQLRWSCVFVNRFHSAHLIMLPRHMVQAFLKPLRGKFRRMES